MDFDALPDFALPLLAAVLAGGAIGFEREWRGRAAGLRTHILVCLASALLMEAAVSQAAWRFAGLPGAEIVSDPTRMAHGVLTGIGFLCAGVIFRAGFSIHGLTTAASLWITAAIGLLFGAGLMPLATTGTVLTVAVLTALRLLSRRLPAQVLSDVEVFWRDAAAATAVERVIAEVDPRRRLDRLERDARTGLSSAHYRIKTADGAGLKALGDRLSATAGVEGWRIDPRDT
jgi:putative Mg2+ transporter-C (MgtC) family protein